MMTTEHSPKAPHSTGIFALLCGLLHIKGTGAGGRALNHRRPLLLVPFILLSLALIAPGIANASFVRKFERQITRAETGHVTEPCSEAQVKAGPPCVAVSGGVAVDGAGDLWVGDSNKHGLDEFSPASAVPPNEFLQTLGVAAPLNMAIESATTGDFYLSSASSVEVYESNGKHLETWGGFSQPRVAIDNSPEGSMKDPSACGTVPYLSLGECFVYVFNGYKGLEKFSSKGTPVEFADSTKCKAESCGYLEGSKITAAPPSVCQGQLSEDGVPPAIAVDSEGDIYIALLHCASVLEYLPSGEFVQAFELESKEVPRIGPNEKVGELEGVAYDPVSHNLLVTASAATSGTETLVGAIDEFEAATGKFVNQITATAAGQNLPGLGEMTVDSNGNVYAAGMDGHGVYVWGRGAYRPTVTVGQVSERMPTSAVLNGSVNPAQHGNTTPAPVTACSFEYVTEAVFVKEGFAQAEKATCEPAEIHIGLEESHPVKATVEHLEAGTTYYYRLVATTESTNNGGTSDSEEVLAFTAPAKPGISEASAEASSTFAELHAKVKPNGANTSYFFEYGPTTAYGHDAPVLTIKAPNGESIGAGGPTGGSVESVLQDVGALTPGTTYHFRVVAENECEAVEHPGRQCVSEGADETFTTLPAAVAGERGYELVTPANKQGGSDMFDAGKDEDGGINSTNEDGVASESGEGFFIQTSAFSSFGEFPFALGGMYAFTRELDRGQWSFASLASPSLGVQGISGGDLVVDPADLSRVAFGDVVGSAVSEEGVHLDDLLGPPGAASICHGAISLEQADRAGCYIDLHEEPPVHVNATETGTSFVGGSRDLSHTVLEGRSTSICPGPGDAAGKIEHGSVLCEWAGGYETLEDGQSVPELKLVNVGTSGEGPVSECGAGLAAGEPGYGSAHSAVAESTDGTRVFFTAPDPRAPNEGKGCWNNTEEKKGKPPVDAPQLYVRLNGESTLEVSQPEKEVEEAGHAPLLYPAEYDGASEDGSKVFFVTKTWMTANHPAGHDVELYECAIVEGACTLSRLSVPLHQAGEPGAGEPDPGAASEVRRVPAVAASGSAVYFVAYSDLAEGATKYEQKVGVDGNVEPGPVNVYRYDTETASTSYVGAIDNQDLPDEPECYAPEQEAGGPCTTANWYTTPDGRYLLFGASTEIEGYNAAADGCAERSLPVTQGVADGRCAELYRYSAQAAAKGEQPVVCVSCGPGEADAAGNAEFARSGLGGPALGAVRAMSDNGEYVFFDSQAALVTQAANHTLDTYQWHEDIATHERSIALVGSGSDSAPTYFLGYSPNPAAHTEQAREAGNVFIGTHAKLSPQDTNGAGNIYDARACEPESPCIEPPTGETAQCEGGSCQHPPPLPLFQSPATNTVASSGNLAAPPVPAPKPKAKPKPKCKKVKKKGKQKTVCAKPKKAKKSSNKKGR